MYVGVMVMVVMLAAGVVLRVWVRISARRMDADARRWEQLRSNRY